MVTGDDPVETDSIRREAIIEEDFIDDDEVKDKGLFSNMWFPRFFRLHQVFWLLYHFSNYIII